MDGRDRDDLEFDAEVLGQFFGVGDGMFRAEAAGHGDADGSAGEVADVLRLSEARLEISAFVKDVVSWEKGFEMAADDFAVAKHGDRVVKRAADGGGIFSGIADDGVDAANARGDRLQAAEVVVDE